MAVARKHARRMARRYPGVRHYVEDLESAALEGLAEAARKFDPSLKIPFQAFALHRIRGAMKDFVRKMDFMSRDMRKAAKAGREDALALTQIRHYGGDTGRNLINTVGRHADQEDSVWRAHIRRALRRAMNDFSPRELHVIRSVWCDGRTLKDIGDEIGVTESRVCQIHNELLDRMKGSITQLDH